MTPLFDTPGPLSFPADDSVRAEALRAETNSGAVECLLRVSALLSASKAASSWPADQIDEVLELFLLDVLFDLIPADIGALIDVENASSECWKVLSRERDAERPRALQIDKSFVSRVIEERTGLLLPAGEDTGGNDASAGDSTSMLAVPVILSDFEKAGTCDRGHVSAVLYFETGKLNPDARFDDGHLQLVTAASIIAANAIENARYVRWLRDENERLDAAVRLKHKLLGESKPMQDLLRQIARVALSDCTVLIMGESGTGKELVARSIHENSPRAARPLIAVNCAALSDTLLESELFGHEKGAFTGAVSQKLGKLELAQGGTMFLDEVGDMSPPLQTKLLRVLQQREFERVGGTRTLPLDIRVVAATNRDLEADVQAGRFRQDLFFRLNVVILRTPPLRERREDILALAASFAARYAAASDRKIGGFTPSAQRLLLEHGWPGNVRELENAIERAVVLGSTEWIRPEDLPPGLLGGPGRCENGSGGSLREAIQDAKRRVIGDVLASTGGNVTRAARMLGVNANYLHRLINLLNLR